MDTFDNRQIKTKFGLQFKLTYNRSMKKLLLTLLLSLGLIGCATNQMLDDGYFYKDIGGAECQSYEVVSPKRINCFDNNGNFTYEQDAMTDQEVIAWKMDEMNASIVSLQTQQMFNNINLQNSINQQNLYNTNNFISTCPWWDIYC